MAFIKNINKHEIYWLIVTKSWFSYEKEMRKGGKNTKAYVIWGYGVIFFMSS